MEFALKTNTCWNSHRTEYFVPCASAKATATRGRNSLRFPFHNYYICLAPP